MITKIRYTIEGSWKEGDPDQLLDTIFRAMNAVHVETAVARPYGRNGLELLRMSDPYDFANSVRQFRKSADIIREKLTEAGYQFQEG